MNFCRFYSGSLYIGLFLFISLVFVFYNISIYLPYISYFWLFLTGESVLYIYLTYVSYKLDVYKVNIKLIA